MFDMFIFLYTYTNMSKSIDAENTLRMGMWTQDPPRIPLIHVQPVNMSTHGQDDLATFQGVHVPHPQLTRGDARGAREMPWALVGPTEHVALKDTVVVEPMPTSLGENKRPEQNAGPYFHFVTPEVMARPNIDQEHYLRYSTESNDRLLELPPAVEFTARDFVGGGEASVYPFNPAGESTRFESVVACSR
jgi:hypothetical protein